MATARCDLCEGPRAANSATCYRLSRSAIRRAPPFAASGLREPCSSMAEPEESDAYYDGRRVFAFATAAPRRRLFA
jgi:hypothetical protein